MLVLAQTEVLQVMLVFTQTEAFLLLLEMVVILVLLVIEVLLF